MDKHDLFSAARRRGRGAIYGLTTLLGLTVAALAQAPSPAQMGITPGSPPTTAPAIVSVLDPSRTWAMMGTVDPTNHIFTPVGGGGGGGGAVTGAPGSFADGWSVTHGSTTDPACTTPTAACSLVALTRAMWNAVQSGVANPGQPFPNPAVGFGGDGGGLLVPVYEADGLPAAINANAAGTSQIIAPPTGGKRLMITGYNIVGTGTGTTALLEYGVQTTTPCDTTAHPLTGPYPPGVPISLGGGLGSIWTIPAGNQLCLVVTGTSPQYSGTVAFTSAP